MIKLTREQEIKYLRGILNGEYKCIGMGSSRKVYDLKNGNVLKIAIDRSAIRQNKMEVIRYKKYHNTKLLANIESYGKFIIIMEYIKPSEVYQIYYENYYEPENEDEDNEIREVEEAKIQIDNLFYNGDNFQMGFDNWGKPKIYDYGYIPNGDCVGYADYYINNENILHVIKTNSPL